MCWGKEEQDVNTGFMNEILKKINRKEICLPAICSDLSNFILF